jgi:ribonucleoside-diphosphate reductase alpha chain
LVDQEDLIARAKAASLICTLQAAYTDFHYLREVWKKTTEKDALIGVSMAGIAAGRVLEFNTDEAAEAVMVENARVAKLIGINKAARCTVIKPDGHTSLVLGASSGVHAYHSNYYLRRVKIEKSSALYTYLAINHPELLEDDFFKPTKEAFIVVPQKAPDGAITRDESALDLLERVRKLYNSWIKGGYRKGANQNNVSATVTIKPDEWDDVGEWMWKHRDEYTALSVMPFSEHTYTQPPFEDTTKTEYQRLVKTLTEVNLNNVVEVRDNTNLKDAAACASGACEVTQ